MSLVVRAGFMLTPEGLRSQGWLRSRRGVIVEMGAGELPEAAEILDLPNCLALPGLVNAHDHMYQWATRGYAPSGKLFDWLTALYPVWAGLDADIVRAAARAAMARLLTAGCTLSADHHYIFPPGRPGIFEALVESAAELGLRFHPCRGSMSLGRSQGGLPPDHIVEREEDILADTEVQVARFHDPRPHSMCRVVIAPCSPFSVTPELMRESASQARRLGLRLHTHLAETTDEERFCRERFGRRPLDLMAEWGWTGEDVWFAHGIHFSPEEIATLAATRTGVAHCPSSNMRLGAGACAVQEMVAAGVRLGLGVDGSASNEDANLAGEVHQAVMLARVRAAILGDPNAAKALDGAAAWQLATRGGAECLGRDDCGVLAPGQSADLAMYRVDDLLHTGMEDPLEALALAPPARAHAVIVNGRVVVREERLLTGDEEEIADGLKVASDTLRRAVHA